MKTQSRSLHTLCGLAAILMLVALPTFAATPTKQKSKTFGSPLKAVTALQNSMASVTEKQASGARVVSLSYGAERTYSIPVRVQSFVTFRFPKDDPIAQIAVSNTSAVDVKVHAPSNTAMIRLTSPVAVNVTAVTKDRTYYMTLLPAAIGEDWYQGVSWSYGDFANGVYTASGDALNPVSYSNGLSGGAGATGGTPNFDYSIQGSADFRPVAVWDNGRFTWIQFRSNIQSLPALFADGPNGLAVINYTVHADGTQILVNRLMPRFVLRLGKTDVVVSAARHSEAR